MVQLHREDPVPADMPHDGAGNIAYQHGNFFQSNDHADGLPRPRGAHQPTKWHVLIVDPDVLSKPAPSWQSPGSRYGLVARVAAGPYFDLGYRGHCLACEGYFLELDWAKDHVCPLEIAFRDVTKREIRDYKELRKDAKQSAKEAVTQKQGIFTAIKNLFQRSK